MFSKSYPQSTHRLSRILQPASVIPKNAEIKHIDLTSKSQRLMLELGYIKQASPGCYHLLPLGVKSLEKLCNLVDNEMRKIGGQKLIFPALTNSKLWEVSGRLDTVSSELFKVKDRHEHSYILSPTYEEVAGNLLASIAPISYKQLPLRLYQITSKFRDEMKPRFGLIRGKQFLMKDMYSFDVDAVQATQTYEEICKSYDKIFNKIGVNFIKVLGHSGHMGGELSHEYHYKADVGEDKIMTCPKCNYLANIELSGEESCPKCRNKSIEINPAIEVGHTFLLGEKYSKCFNTKYSAADGKPHLIQMGSYGLGLSRIIAAVVEVLSTEEEIRWPPILAPYTVIIIPPKRGSKEELNLDPGLVDKLYSSIEKIDQFENNVIIDDRTHLTIGRRYLEAKRNGYPYIVTIGKTARDFPPLFELTELETKTQMFVTESYLLDYIKKKTIY